MKCIIHDKSMKSFSIEAEIVKVTCTTVYVKPIYSMGLTSMTLDERKRKAVAFCRENNRLKRAPMDYTKIMELILPEETNTNNNEHEETK